LIRLGRYTVPFHSIRQALWPVMDLPKFWFRQTPKVAVTERKILAVYCWRPQKIAHIGLSRKIISAGPPWALWWPWHFSIWKARVTRDCRIEWNGTVVLYGEKTTSLQIRHCKKPSKRRWEVSWKYPREEMRSEMKITQIRDEKWDENTLGKSWEVGWRDPREEMRSEMKDPRENMRSRMKRP